MKELTSAERVLRVLRREEPDRIPHFEWIIDRRVRDALCPGSSMEEFTVQEILEQRLEKQLPFLKEPGMILSEGRQIALSITRARTIKEMQMDYDIDDDGDEKDPDGLVDLSPGW